MYVTTGGHEDSFLWSFDANDGTVLFRSAYANQWSRYYAPAIVGQTVYMAGGSYGGMYAFSATDGQQLWFTSTNQYDEWAPAVSDGRVYAYTGDYSPKLTVADAATGSVLYEIADPGFQWDGWSMGVTPVLGSADNVLVTQGGRLLSFDLRGRSIAWERTGSFRGNVTVAGGVLYVNNRQIEARAESDGSLLWVWIPPHGEPQGTIIVTDNLLFTSTADRTYALDLGARRQVWSYPMAGQLALSSQGKLFIAASDGRLAAIGLR